MSFLIGELLSSTRYHGDCENYSVVLKFSKFLPSVIGYVRDEHTRSVGGKRRNMDVGHRGGKGLYFQTKIVPLN